MSALSSLVLTGERVNFQIEFAPEQRLDRPPTRGAPAPQRRAPRGLVLKQANAAANSTIQEQAARIHELERRAAAHAENLAGACAASDERAARAELAFNTARDQLVESQRLSAAELRSARESHTSELVGLRCAYSELAAESKRVAYALSGQITTVNAPPPAKTELRRDADSMELRHSLLIAGLSDRITQVEDYSLRQRTAILERDQYIQYLRRLIATISQDSRARARSLAARPVSTDAHPATDDACPPGPFLLGTAQPAAGTRDPRGFQHSSRTTSGPRSPGTSLRAAS